MKLGIIFSLLLSFSAFAAESPKAKKFNCRYDRKQIVEQALDLADKYAGALKANPQIKEATVLPAATINRLSEKDLFDFTVVVPIDLRTTEGPAIVVTLYPSDEAGKTALFQDMVIPFMIHDTGAKKKCEILAAMDASLSDGQVDMLPIFKVMTTKDPVTVLDAKKLQENFK